MRLAFNSLSKACLDFKDVLYERAISLSRFTFL
jgi:hypothetical protein